MSSQQLARKQSKGRKMPSGIGDVVNGNHGHNEDQWWFKMSVVVGGVDLGGRIDRRWLVGIGKLFETGGDSENQEKKMLLQAATTVPSMLVECPGRWLATRRSWLSYSDAQRLAEDSPVATQIDGGSDLATWQDLVV